MHRYRSSSCTESDGTHPIITKTNMHQGQQLGFLNKKY
jgi:hypothetical protein